MRLQDIQNIASGIPSGFNGQKANWKDVCDVFTIERIAITKRDARNKEGEIITYSKGPRAGEPVPDLQAILQIKTEAGERYIVRTNSSQITSLFSGYVFGAEADDTNRFGDQIFYVDVPEGRMKFVPYEKTYADKTKGQICDIVEVAE